MGATKIRIAGDIQKQLQPDKSAEYELALEAAEIGTWEWDIRTNRIKWSERVYGFHGVQKDDFDGTIESFMQLIHPDDRERVKAAIDQALRTGNEYEVELRIVQPSGEIRYLYTRGKAFFENGRAVRLVGATIDLTENELATQALRKSEELFRTVQDASPDGFIMLKALREQGTIVDFEWVYWNKAAGEALSRNPSEYIGQRLKTKMPLAASQRFATYVHVVETGTPVIEEVQYTHDGTDKRFRMTIIKADDGIAVIFADITNQYKVQQQLEQSVRRFKSLVDQSLFSIQILDLHGHTVRVNKAWEELWGITLEQLTEWKYNILHDPQLRQKGVLPYIERAYQGEAAEIPAIMYDPAESKITGKRRWVRAYIYPVKDKEGVVEEVVLMHEDITDRKEAEELIRKQAMQDSLTGLPNRKSIEEKLTSALTLSQANNTQGAVMFLDLDRFKNINDTLGHTIGDMLLKEVAQRLRSSMSEQDTVGRLGGDEFIIILENIEDVRDASRAAERIFATLRKPIRIGDLSFHVTTSIGITIFPSDGTEPFTILKHADTALYRAKESGRNRHHFYNQTMELQTSERFTLENELRTALEGEELVLYYQPIVDVKANKLIAQEALVRWQHPRLGLVFPNEFIPLAEERGLITQLGEFVLRSACKQRKQWFDEGHKEFRVAVNVSAQQFAETSFVSSVRAVLAETNLEPTLLELEITESVASENMESAIEKLWELRRMGIHIAIDDFGMGYSSLSYLRRIPVHTLKIDRSFVHHCDTDEQDASIIRTIISMAHTLNLQFVAEGVETQAQVDFLASMHCFALQGYFIRRPVPASEATAWLRSRHVQS